MDKINLFKKIDFSDKNHFYKEGNNFIVNNITHEDILRKIGKKKFIETINNNDIFVVKKILKKELDRFLGRDKFKLLFSFEEDIPKSKKGLFSKKNEGVGVLCPKYNIEFSFIDCLLEIKSKSKIFFVIGRKDFNSIGIFILKDNKTTEIKIGNNFIIEKFFEDKGKIIETEEYVNNKNIQYSIFTIIGILIFNRIYKYI